MNDAKRIFYQYVILLTVSLCLFVVSVLLMVLSSQDDIYPPYFFPGIALFVCTCVLVFESTTLFFKRILRIQAVRDSIQSAEKRSDAFASIENEIVHEYPLWITLSFSLMAFGVFMTIHKYQYSWVTGIIFIVVGLFVISAWLFKDAWHVISQVRQKIERSTQE